MKDVLEKKVAEVCKQLFDVEVSVGLTRPEEQFGDYATNVALQLSKQLGKNPREIAEALAVKLRETLAEQVREVSIAGPGFLNFKLADQYLLASLQAKPQQKFANQKILVEFGDPNPLKTMHLGHLYTTVVGDAISSLFEVAGAEVTRVSYHGDVGLHIAKAIYAINQEVGGDISKLNELDKSENYVGHAVLAIKSRIGYLYAKGAQAFEENPEAAQEIREINKHVYLKDDVTINAIYKWGVEASFRYFEDIFNILGVRYKKRYLESEASKLGIETVRSKIGKVFEESDSAVIFKGEKVGLHTRVFINSEGLPTYEAKDLGLAELKNHDYPKADQSVIITAHEQVEYFKVMLAALREFEPELAAKTHHIAHGFLSLTTGKMSSRTGQVHGAQTLLDDVLTGVEKVFPDGDQATLKDVYVAAIKYTFLKNRVGGDIVFDVQESVALEGNSGPYLQYAHVRARSILRKAGSGERPTKSSASPERATGSAAHSPVALAHSSDLENSVGLQPGERSLARKISEYPEVIDKAVNELMPHHVCTYLYELAQVFNRFYENSRVIGDPRQDLRLALVGQYAETLRAGLGLLGITAPDKM